MLFSLLFLKQLTKFLTYYHNIILFTYRTNNSRIGIKLVWTCKKVTNCVQILDCIFTSLDLYYKRRLVFSISEYISWDLGIH